MRHTLLTASLFIVSCLTYGCSGSAGVDGMKNTSISTSNIEVPSNQNQSVGTNSASSIPGDKPFENTLGNSNKRKITEVPGGGRPVLQFEPAPENSQIAQAMNSSGQMFEVRIWKGHPQLLKVESVWVDQKNKALTIMLRSTKVLNITTDRIPNLKLATAKQLLEIAGVQPTAATPAVKDAPKKTQ